MKVPCILRNSTTTKILQIIFLHVSTCYRPSSGRYAVHINNKCKYLIWAGHVGSTEEKRGAYRALMGKPEGRRSLGRPRHRWEDNIKMDLRDFGRGEHGLDQSGSG
jgi:hypothetical protein